MTPQPIFELVDPATTGAAPVPPGVWMAVPGSPSEAVVFEAASPAADAPLWRANLPADPGLAAAHLDSAEASLAASREALAVASDRLKVFVEAQVAGLAFEVGPAETQPGQAEAELAVSLRRIQDDSGPTSYSPGEALTAGWEQAAEQLQTIAGRTLGLAAEFGWVETRVEGQLVGRSAISWTGDLDTVWQGRPGPTEAALHGRTLALALTSRETFLRRCALVARGAATLSVLLAAPGGALLALPAAWRFIQQVLAELGQEHEEEA